MPLLMLLALDHDNHGTEGDVKSAITSTLPQETVGLYRNRDSITKDGHALSLCSFSWITATTVPRAASTLRLRSNSLEGWSGFAEIKTV